MVLVSISTEDLLICSDEDEVELDESGKDLYERECVNCGRLASSERSIFFGEDGGRYCGQNCYWSKQLDKTNARLKIGKKVRRRVNKADEPVEGDGIGQKAGLVRDSVKDGNNALFLYHAYFCGAYSLRTRQLV